MKVNAIGVILILLGCFCVLLLFVTGGSVPGPGQVLLEGIRNYQFLKDTLLAYLSLFILFILFPLGLFVSGVLAFSKHKSWTRKIMLYLSPLCILALMPFFSSPIILIPLGLFAFIIYFFTRPKKIGTGTKGINVVIRHD